MIGKTISHYKILEKLGEGGMGVVYKAEDTKLKRDVAIKFLPRLIVASEEERARFKNEAQAAAALNHPNIATIHAIEEIDDEMFIVMEYIEGRELRDIVGAQHAVPLPDVLNYASQIAAGLQAAHEKDVTHRDIKSSNIMITDKDQVKIMDFGLAKMRGSAQLTKVGTTLGTAAYMSPEQAQSLKTDHRTDIWAFGVVLYEMLTGRMPFPGDYEQAVIYSILNEEPESITHIRPEIDKRMESLVGRTLAKNRDERYQNIHESLIDLKTIAKGEPTLDMDRKPAVKSKISASTKLWLGVAGIVGITFIILFAFVFNSSEPGLISNEKSIAVMPFADMSPEKDQAYFADGMAEEIINALTQIPGLKVSARTSAFQFREQENDIQTIGEKLGVTTILKGSVRKSGNTLRITVQLVNVADGFHLWSETYDRQLTDVFVIQDDLSNSIVNALQVKLSGDEVKTLDTRMPTSVEAYNFYLKGRYFWNKRTEEGLQKSIEFFQQAIDLDPTYALAYAGLADAYVILGWWQYLEPKETFTKAKSAARKAIEIDDSLAEAHAALAFSKFTYDWDWQGAEKEFKRAIALNPKYASAHQWYADWLGIMGRYDEARAEIRKALELDPLSLIINAASGLLYQYAGDDDKAIRQLNKTLEMDPNFIPAHSWLFGSYLRKGMHDKSFNHFIAAYSAFYELTSEEKDAVHTIYEDFGWDGVARFMIAKLEVRSKEKYVSPADLSMYYVLLGDHEQALDYLEKAYQIRSSRMAYLGVMPEFEALHSEPRFQALLKKVGLPQ